MKKIIERVEYNNDSNQIDFEIVDIQSFFASRPHTMLMKDYRLDFWVILYIVEGSGIHYIDFEGHTYHEGDALFIQRNQVQRFLVNNEVKGYIMHINEPFFYLVEGFSGDVFLDFLDRSYGSPILSIDCDQNATSNTLVELLYSEYQNVKNELNIDLLATLFQGFILSLKAHTPKPNKVMLTKDYENFKAYRRLVEEHYTSTRNVEEYASMMHLSKKTINQATRNVVGLSAKQYIIDRIILEIKRYLSQGVLMNYEIADILGFGEAANMTKFFKHYVGQSPKEFREQRMG